MRMTLGFAAVLALLVLSVTVGIWNLHWLSAAATSMTERSGIHERLTHEWLLGTTSNSIRTIALVKSDDPTLQAYLQKNIEQTSANISEIQKKLEPLLDTAEERALIAEIAATRLKYVDARKLILNAKAAGSNAQAAEMIDKLIPLLDTYLDSIRQMLVLQQKTIDASAREADAKYRTARWIMIALGALGVPAATGAWLLTRSIARRLREAVKVAQTVASGDLTATGSLRITSEDETGQLVRALGTMNENLARLVGQVRVGTDTIAASSEQLTAGNQELANRTEQQAASLEQTVASMGELTHTVKQNAENAQQASRQAQSASDVAVKGGKAVREVVQTMGSINASAKKMHDIISVIDGIAFQTNILALNAAVEAARAGDQGLGFAVVATEVRSLAQRSAAAAKEIKVLIDDSVFHVSAGSDLVAEAGQTMQEVVTSIKRVTDLVGDISAASREQTAGIEQVNTAIAQMDRVTQQNAGLVEQAAAVARDMQEQSTTLVEAVKVFKLPADDEATRAIARWSARPAPALPHSTQEA